MSPTFLFPSPIGHSRRAPIVAIHGTASNAGQWKALSQTMAGERKILTPNIPGYGSCQRNWQHEPVGLTHRLVPILKELEAMNDRFHLVGHSFGGALALRIAELMPERVVSVTVYEPTSLGVFFGEHNVSDIALLGDLRRLGDIAANASPLVAMESFINFWMGGDHWCYLPEKAKCRIAGFAAPAARDFVDALSDMEAGVDSFSYDGPVNVQVGRNTVPVAKRIAELLMQRMTNIEFKELKGLGHLGPITDPEVFNKEIKTFVDRTAAREWMSEPTDTVLST